MCLILIAYRHRPEYPLLVAANRDEFFERPTQTAQFWTDCPSVLAGRDLRHGGTWLGVDRAGRFAAVANYREPSEADAGAVSRGLLVSNFLVGDMAPDPYLSVVSAASDRYDGFNLFVGDQTALYFYSSYLQKPLQLEPGIHGISNGDLDSPWPKLIKGKEGLRKQLRVDGEVDAEQLFKLLADRTVPTDASLPDSGVGIEWERKLAPIFVNGNGYGTRSSTLLICDRHGRVNFTERNFDQVGNRTGDVHYSFSIESPAVATGRNRY
ncbi:MAG: NRDE family protein [Gammaproteobacteria bacterium]